MGFTVESQEVLTDDPARILVVDDDRVIRDVLTDFLSTEGYLVRAVENGLRAVEELRRTTYDIVISDLKIPNMGGLELLEEIKRHDFKVLTIIMTGFGTVESAIQAMKRGAYDYVLKPFKFDEIVHIIKRGLERQRLEIENIQLKEAVSLYRISQAIAEKNDLGAVLDLILDVSIMEAEADLIQLHLREDGQERWVESLHRTKAGIVEDVDAGEPNMDELLHFFEDGVPVRAHGVATHVFFLRLPGDLPLVSFCSVPLRLQERLVGVINAYSFTRGHRFTEGHRKLLAVLGSRAAGAIENARLVKHLRQTNDQLRQVNLSLQKNFLKTIQGFAKALEENDRYTRGHSERVAIYTRLIAEGMGMDEARIELAYQAGLMHDIGKIGIAYEKLNKPGKLSPSEVEMFRRHPIIGQHILEGIPFMKNLIPGIKYHHEHFDGTGYPEGLAGENIPLLGRVIAVADTYDAMTSDRPYRKALPHEVARDELIRCTGTQFDPSVVEVFLKKIEIYRDDVMLDKQQES